MGNSVRAFKSPLPEIAPSPRNNPAGLSIGDITRLVMDEHYRTNEELRNFLSAIDKTEAVTGRLTFDTCKATELIAKLASERGFPTGVHDLNKIGNAMNEWLRLRGLSRKERKSNLLAQEVDIAVNDPMDDDI
jgi:hypothetical protein